MIISYIIETLSQHLSPHHEQYAVFSQKYHGEIVAITYKEQRFNLCIHHSGVVVCNKNKEPTTTITFNLEALLAFSGFKHSDASVNITGDHALGHAFSQLLSAKKISGHSLLDTILPQDVSIGALEIIDNLRRAKRYSANALGEQIHHYLVYEAGLCVDNASSDDQYQKILKLKWMIDHLKTR
jgi:ubiquinone biosynthesis protein UbiJ